MGRNPGKVNLVSRERTGKARQGDGIVRQGGGREGAAETPRLTRLTVPGFRPSPNRAEENPGTVNLVSQKRKGKAMQGKGTGVNSQSREGGEGAAETH